MLNGGFENFTLCPTSNSTEFLSQIEYCNGWYSPTLGTSDYFNTCSVSSGNPYTFVGVPNNFVGNQTPNDGDGYAGIYAYVSWINGKEYIQSKLTNPLKKGVVYKFSFYVSLADSSEFALDNLTAIFTKNSNLTSNIYPILYSNNNYGPKIIYSDTIN